MILPLLHINVGKNTNLSSLLSPQRFGLSSLISCLFLLFLVPVFMVAVLWQLGDPRGLVNTQNCDTHLCFCSCCSLCLECPSPNSCFFTWVTGDPSRFGLDLVFPYKSSMISLAGEDASSLYFHITLWILNIYFCDFLLLSYLTAEMSHS